MAEIEYRTATPDDAGQVLRIMSCAFAREAGTQKYERDRRRLETEIDTHRVLVQDGVIVGALHLAFDKIQVGRSTVVKADIGEVCVSPEYQGQGLGTTMMQFAVEQLKLAGYHLSRLGGYRQFYERFGWVPFPRGSIDFALRGLTSRGGYTDPVAYLDRPEEDARIRPYDGRLDAAECAALYASFNKGRTGARPARSFGRDDGDPWRVVYEVDGAVLGYVFASPSDPPHTKLASAVSISDGASDPADPRPLGEALRYVLRHAAIAGAEWVRARLPLDPSLYGLYRDASCGFTPSLWHSSEGGNMVQVLSLRGLLEAIAPELTDRLSAAEMGTREIGIRVKEEAVRVAWDGERVTVSEEETDSVAVGQDGLMKMVLGLLPVEHVVEKGREEMEMLRLMFPVQGTATGVWG